MAVYTDVSFEDLETFLSAYALGAVHAFKGIAEGVSNSNYFLQTTQGSYILTLYEKRIEVEELPFFLSLMEHLAQAGLPCPLPVHARNGSMTGRLNGRAAAILSFLDGVSLRRPTAEHCGRAGRALAGLHAAGASFPEHRANALGLKGWQKLALDCDAHADGVSDGSRALIDSEIAFLSRNWPTGLPEGIIHADFFPDNVLFLNDQVSGIIDFYFACNDAFAYDIAATLCAWCFEPDGAYNLTKGRALLGGYQAIRKLTDAERAALPLLARGAALRFLLTRLYDWVHQEPGALVRPKDPKEYARILRFHRNVRSPEAYGL
jgi:homoserine kinase type II